MSIKPKQTEIPQNTPLAGLPLIGKSRWEQVRPYVGVSRETWRKLYIDGKAPTPQRVSKRVTLYDNAEIHKWIADPQGYRCQGGK